MAPVIAARKVGGGHEHASEPGGDTLSLRSASDVSEAFARMFGPNAPLPRGVVHVSAVAECEGQRFVLRVGKNTPSSQHDLFLLGVVRASTQAVVTTGEILRREPALRHDRYGPTGLHGALLDWRQELGLEQVPRSLVLTSGRNIDTDHALFLSENDVTILTGAGAPPPFLSAMQERAIDVLQVESPSVRVAIERLQKVYGVRDISIEAGPTSTRNLYTAPLAVREVLLSVFHGNVDRELLVAEFADPGVLRREFQATAEPYQVNTARGTWSFHRIERTGAND